MSDTGSTAILRARELRKNYGKDDSLVRAVDGVDLDVAPGETVAVMGPSGCGKSTLLHMLGGLERPTAGEIWLAGRRIDKLGERALAGLRRDGIGIVFQAFHLLDELTAAGQQRVADWLAEVSWPRPDLAEFHLKLAAAAAAGLADPVTIVGATRRELLARLREAQRAAMAEPDGSGAGLLLEGVVLRLQADLRWLEACERYWVDWKGE